MLMSKLKIDQEIAEIENILDERESTHPDYLPPELKELQARVLTVHAHIETTLENRIIVQINAEECLSNNNRNPRLIVPTLEALLEKMSFAEKNRVVEGFKDGFPVKAVKKVNMIRIEFAHPRGSKLCDKYNLQRSQGKENKRDALRALLNAKKQIDSYLTSHWDAFKKLYE
jgi:hypothetical protein